MNKILMVLVFGLVLAITAQPTNNAAEEKGKYRTVNVVFSRICVLKIRG